MKECKAQRTVLEEDPKNLDMMEEKQSISDLFSQSRWSEIQENNGKDLSSYEKENLIFFALEALKADHIQYAVQAILEKLHPFTIALENKLNDNTDYKNKQQDTYVITCDGEGESPSCWRLRHYYPSPDPTNIDDYIDIPLLEIPQLESFLSRQPAGTQANELDADAMLKIRQSIKDYRHINVCQFLKSKLSKMPIYSSSNETI
jgi:hypothetical protein